MRMRFSIACVCLAEGFDSAAEGTQLRLNAVDSYLALLQTDTSLLPQRFLQVISWVRAV